MKILKNKKINSFFNRCLNNIENDYINNYIGVVFDPSEEQKIKEELHDLKVKEFMGSHDKWPSLFISVDDYLKTPYHSTIKLDGIVDDDYEYIYETFPANELFNADVVIADPKRELNDSLVLRAYDKPYKTTILKQGEEYWMSDTYQEARTIDPYAQKAHGKVLTFGLGIGYFVFMALLNPNVDSVTIVERSPSVIKMFKKYLLPQFSRKKDVEIIQGDAFKYFNKKFIDQFDYTFVDIWKSNDDGYEIIKKMLQQYNPDFEKINFWIEETCTEFLTSLIFLYFYNLANNKKSSHSDKDYDLLLRKIDTYFSKINLEVDDEEILKDYMYDLKVKRDILAIK